MHAAALAGWQGPLAAARRPRRRQAAVRVLEDDPGFTPGAARVLNRDGPVELDASIMEGDRLQVRRRRRGSARRQLRFTLARRILDESRHVCMEGERGARISPRSAGIAECRPGGARTDPSAAAAERAARRAAHRRHGRRGRSGPRAHHQPPRRRPAAPLAGARRVGDSA